MTSFKSRLRQAGMIDQILILNSFITIAHKETAAHYVISNLPVLPAPPDGPMLLFNELNIVSLLHKQTNKQTSNQIKETDKDRKKKRKKKTLNAMS